MTTIEGHTHPTGVSLMCLIRLCFSAVCGYGEANISLTIIQVFFFFFRAVLQGSTGVINYINEG